MPVSGAEELITTRLQSWQGVSTHPHRFDGVEYRLGSRELGHIHGDHLVDVPFPTKVRNEIVASRKALAHQILPDSGWVSIYLRQAQDIDQAIDLLRQSYEIASRQRLLADTGTRPTNH